MHLVSNAAKFTKNGAIHISGTRSSADGRVRLAFTVADTGIGIGPAQQARIFDPFEQADGDADRRFEGTGLGLTLVRRLAQLMGGGVSVESTPGKGSVFTLWVDGGPA
jgi:signal transduction histidine kinase